MKTYYFYAKLDKSKEPIGKTTGVFLTRLNAAKAFAQRKQLDLKDFLAIYAVSR